MAFDADTESESASLHHHLPLPERYKCLSRNTISLWVLYCMYKFSTKNYKRKKNWAGSIQKNPQDISLKKKLIKETEAQMVDITCRAEDLMQREGSLSIMLILLADL